MELSPFSLLLSDISWPVWLALSVLVAMGTMLQIGIGTGFGTVAAPGAMLLAPPLIPGTMVCLGLATSVLGARSIPGRIAIDELVLALIGRTGGAAAAAVVVATLGGRDVFGLVFAGLTLLGVALSVSGLRLPPSPPALLGAGFLSGLMATITTAGGPPMALIYQHQPLDKARPTLNAFFGFGQIPPLVALWLAGALDWAAIGRAALLVPAIGLGVALSPFVAPYFDKRYKTIMLGFCVVAAVVIGVRAMVRLFV